ncbi:ComEC/Rec2 family competence protein [Natronomonas amylolytica]|uniref:ComEC/Rec2 family competence protein n=1 Tax=Natronomonas amylolytica TaxID=3108498 RepID=UPI00300AF25B
MRRQLAVIAVCGVLVLSGCAAVQFDVEPRADTEPDPATDSTAAAPGAGNLEVHFINVGQADATLLRTDEETMLIDSGGWRDDGETVIDYLEARGVDRIDHLVATHGHADHIGGHAAVIDHYETEKDGVGAVYDSGVTTTSQTYERYLDAIERHDVDLFEVASGDEIPFNGTGTTVLNPESPGGKEPHPNGVAVHVAVGETAFLFTGDAERETEREILDRHGDAIEADVYQAGHHGSDTSSGPEFLDTVDPDIAVVSSAYDSQYGHPHDEPLQRFADRDTEAVWTAVHGTVVIEADGETITVRTQHDATTDPLEIQSADAATADPADATEERFTLGDASGHVAPVGARSGPNGVTP